jgi:hypothetical protein
VQRPPSRQTAICTRAQTVTSTKTLAVDGKNTAVMEAGIQRTAQTRPVLSNTNRATSSILPAPLAPPINTHKAARGHKECNRRHKTDKGANNRASATSSNGLAAKVRAGGAGALGGERGNFLLTRIKSKRRAPFLATTLVHGWTHSEEFEITWTRPANQDHPPCREGVCEIVLGLSHD